MNKKKKGVKKRGKMKSKKRTSVKAFKKISNSIKKKNIKNEFDNFANSVAKLETMRHELNSLDAKGFQPRVKIIKAKLKDINQIPKIRRELNELEGLIKRQHSRKVLKSMHTKKLLKKSKSVEQDHFILKKKIKEFEQKLNSKKKLACKKQLTHKEVEDIKDFPKVERLLNALRKDFVEHTKVSKMKIDSGVGILVDTKFADFINEIKAELTERLKSKEMTIDIELKADLEKHEELFQRRYADLVNEFHQKYANKVENELRLDINRRFNEKLEGALERKKKEIVSRLIKEDSLRLSSEKKKMMDELYYKQKEREGRLSKRYSTKEKVLSKGYESKEKNLNQQVQEMEEDMQRELMKKKDELHSELMKKSQGLDKTYKAKLKSELLREKQRLESSLKEEYRIKLIDDVRRKDVQMERKKQELQRYVVDQARKLLSV